MKTLRFLCLFPFQVILLSLLYFLVNLRYIQLTGEQADKFVFSWKY
jgi:hypothetical protein